MTLSLKDLARTIAKARHGTDAMWANYMGAAEAARREVVEECAEIVGDAFCHDPMGQEALDETAAKLRALIAQPDGA